MPFTCRRFIVLIVFSVVAIAPASRAPADGEPSGDSRSKDNIGHRHHFHHHNPPHGTAAPGDRFHTNRQAAPLVLPLEDDAFFFAVFGDRTGGAATGVSVLADAVRDVNLLEPDLVMTVGDLINGYSEAPPWLRQMREFKDIMNELICPWFPVAGNHDTYYRGPVDRKPVGEHDSLYEIHFGPLWYAFEHKRCWFIVLYSDEGDPDTGEKSFRKPSCQRISPEQFRWLDDTLRKARDADHVFCFLHHPRWLGGGYGDDWQRVHQRLVAAGNVRAVFAGHIHQMHYAESDGIEYVTLATVGAHQSGKIPEAGYLHHFNLVTVRKKQIAIAAIPVGEVMDPRELTDAMQKECIAMIDQPLRIDGAVRLDENGGGNGQIRTRLSNVTRRPVEVTVTPETTDSRWLCRPDHVHDSLAPGASVEYAFDIHRPARTADSAFELLHLGVHVDYLAPGARYSLPSSRVEVPIDLYLGAPDQPDVDHGFAFNGQSAYAEVSSSAIALPDGPLTLECWFNARGFSKRVGLVTKTEISEYGLFVSGGQPSFSVFLDHGYVTATGKPGSLQLNRWHHLAGVFDGRTVRLYLDGKRVGERDGHGSRRVNDLPLVIGADVNGKGGGTAHFHGTLDEVRLSSTARYAGSNCETPRRLAADQHTHLLLHADGNIGPWAYDDSTQHAHPRLRSGAAVVAITDSRGE